MGIEFITVAADSASLQFSWPDRRELRMSSSLPVESVPEAQRMGKEPATAAAVAYMRQHFPWARDAAVKAEPSGDMGDWHISWKKTAAGVLMPLRLDLVVDARGRIASFSSRDIPDPRLAPVLVDAAAARSIVMEAAAPASPNLGDPFLAALPVHDTWRPVWRFPVLGPATAGRETAIAMVDAETGKVMRGTPGS
ncbi:hypothetical protein ACIQV3_22175 [Streptomyces sp. NPDC099050]|uniref:hypothetical protein n=1 Tax=Streptomyces sp. NPDC099050 TaxID=3366100 RepID=UPI00382DF931